MRIIEPSVRVVWSTPNPVFVIEEMGRICYQSEPDIDCECGGFTCEKCYQRAAEFVKRRLITTGHGSALEHACLCLRMVSDRGVSHEVVRHRIGMSYSQESTRYCNYSKEKFGGVAFIRPLFEEKHDVAEDCWNNPLSLQWVKDMEYAEKSYLNALERGAAPQMARAWLPTCLKTEIGITGNVRAWRHFLGLRLHVAAHPQIRQVSKMIRDELMTWAAPLFEDTADAD